MKNLIINGQAVENIVSNAGVIDHVNVVQGGVTTKVWSRVIEPVVPVVGPAPYLRNLGGHTLVLTGSVYSPSFKFKSTLATCVKSFNNHEEPYFSRIASNGQYTWTSFIDIFTFTDAAGNDLVNTKLTIGMVIYTKDDSGSMSRYTIKSSTLASIV